jgi:hypothetical protein
MNVGISANDQDERPDRTIRSEKYLLPSVEFRSLVAFANMEEICNQLQTSVALESGPFSAPKQVLVFAQTVTTLT